MRQLALTITSAVARRAVGSAIAATCVVGVLASINTGVVDSTLVQGPEIGVTVTVDPKAATTANPCGSGYVKVGTKKIIGSAAEPSVADIPRTGRVRILKLATVSMYVNTGRGTKVCAVTKANPAIDVEHVAVSMTVLGSDYSVTGGGAIGANSSVITLGGDRNARRSVVGKATFDGRVFTATLHHKGNF